MSETSKFEPQPNDTFILSKSDASDQEWLQFFVRSQHNEIVDGLHFPRFPDEAVQARVHGSSGEKMLQEAGRFITEIKRYVEKDGRSINRKTRILDFGCGWGRMIRFFINQVESKNLYGIDVDPDLVELAHRLNPYAQFLAIDYLPRTPFEKDYFDIIYAFSVFSHLSEDVGLAWIKEFARILKPKGLLLVTTRSRSFIELCATLRKHPVYWDIRSTIVALLRGSKYNKSHTKKLRECFKDTASALQEYDDGKLLFCPIGGGIDILDNNFYGEALIPPKYVRNSWQEYLEVVDFVDTPTGLNQALIVLRGR